MLNNPPIENVQWISFVLWAGHSFQFDGGITFSGCIATFLLEINNNEMFGDLGEKNWTKYTT
jgi:hypothetical protein